MKFYILKDQKMALCLVREREGPGVRPIVESERNTNLRITNIIPSDTSSEVAQRICKKLNSALNIPTPGETNENNDSGCSSSRTRTRVQGQRDYREAFLALRFLYGALRPTNMSVTGVATGLLDHFKSLLQVEPTSTSMKMKLRGDLWFHEPEPSEDVLIRSNPLKYFGGVVTVGRVPTKIVEDSYMFTSPATLKLAPSLAGIPTDRWNNPNLLFSGTFSVSLTVEGVSEDFFMDKNISDKMSITRKLLNEGLDSDVKIVVDNGTVIACHKAFLSAHSQVFASMLNGNFKEAESKEIKLPGRSEEAIRALLAYVYCWDTSVPLDDPVIAVELYKIAHEYDIKPLQTCMGRILEKKNDDYWLDTETALSLLPIIGNRDDTDVMKKTVLRFFIKNAKKMRESESFREIFEKTPNTAIDLYEEVCGWKNKDID